MDYSSQFGLSLTGGNEIDQIDDQITTLNLELNSVILSLSNESEARETADNQIIQDLSGEIVLRIQNDNQIIQDLSGEIVLRIQNDNQIIQDLSGEILLRIQNDNQIIQDLSGEILSRQQGDANLQTNINTERAERIYADLAIDLRLDDIEAEIDAIDLLITGGQHIIDINDDIDTLKANTSNAFIRYTENDDNLIIGTIDNGVETNQIRYNTDVGAFNLLEPNASIVLNDTTNTTSRWQITTTAGKTIFNYIASSGVVDTIFTINSNGNIEVDNVITTQGNLNNILQSNLSTLNSLQSSVSALQQLQQDLQDELNSTTQDSDGNPVLGIVGTIFGVGNTLSIGVIALQVATNTTAIAALATAVGVLQGSNLASTVSNLSDTVANVSELATETSSLISRVGEAGDCVLGEGTGSTASAYNFRLIDSDITNVGNMFFKNTIVGKIQNLTKINDVLLLDVSGVEIPQSLTIACDTTFGNELFYKTETLDTRFVNQTDYANNNTAIQSSLNTKVTITDVTNAITGLVDDAPIALDTLRELATALDNRPNFANEVLALIGTNTTNLNDAIFSIGANNNLRIDGDALKLDKTGGSITGNLAVNGTITVGGGGENKDLLYFDTTRDWKFKTIGIGASNELVLQSMNSKIFRIRDHTDTDRFMFNTQTGHATITGELTTSQLVITSNFVNSTTNTVRLKPLFNTKDSWFQFQNSTTTDSTNNIFDFAIEDTFNRMSTRNNRNLVLRSGNGSIIAESSLTVTNPAEINYKNQTLDTRFVSQTAYNTNNTEILTGFGEFAGSLLTINDASIARDALKLDKTGGTVSGNFSVDGTAQLGNYRFHPNFFQTNNVDFKFAKWFSGETFMTIKYDSGNVGIGTENPSARLDVVGSAKISNTLAVGSTNSINNTLQARYIRFQRVTNILAGFNLSEIRVFGTNGLQLNNSTWTVAMSSQLGIFAGSNLIDENLASFAHTAVDNLGEFMEVDMKALQTFSHFLLFNRVGFFNRAIGLTVILKDNNGNVIDTPFLEEDAQAYGIFSGTASRVITSGNSTYTFRNLLSLDVKGSAKMSGSLEIQAQMRCQGLAGSGNRNVVVNFNGIFIALSSDRRLKENFEPINESETHLKLLKLEPKTYQWKDREKYGDYREIGMIAQEVKEVLPELVFQNNDGIYGIHYDKISILMLQSIKQLQKQIDELKNEIIELRK